jgi:hypothetical protein
VRPAIPPPITTTSNGSSSAEEGMLFANLVNFIGCSMLVYQEGYLLPDVLFSQPFLLLSPFWLIEPLNELICLPLKSIVNIINTHYV